MTSEAIINRKVLKTNYLFLIIILRAAKFCASSKWVKV
jgi:hypothetical protein